MIDQQSNGGSDNSLGLALSAVSFGTGVYADYIHSHKIYMTTDGEVKSIYKPNGAYRSARAAQFGQMSKFVKRLGVAGSVVSTGYSVNNIINDANAGGINNVKPLDVADGE